MNLQEFQQLSKRTMPFGGEPANQVEFENMLGNYAMGLVGEAVELLEAKVIGNGQIIKEIGDVAHYAVGIAAIMKIDLPIKPTLISKPLSMIFNRLLFASKEISEQVKKHIYHRHELDISPMHLNIIFDCLYTLMDYYDLEGNALQTNIDKLKTRYPEKFNTADSIARKDVQA